jgi:hypothetical protein
MANTYFSYRTLRSSNSLHASLKHQDLVSLEVFKRLVDLHVTEEYDCHQDFMRWCMIDFYLCMSECKS